MDENRQDFRYVLQDFSNVYIGARLTYGQLTEQDDTPQRLSTAIYRYLMQDGLENTRICDHLMILSAQTVPYMIYAQLKAEMKVVQPVTKIHKNGRQVTEYKVQTYPVTVFAEDEALRGQIRPEQISEITFKKLHLMSLKV